MFRRFLNAILPPKRITRVQVIHRDPLRITMDEFRGDPNMVQMAKGVLNIPEVKIMLDVLRTEHLANYQLRGATLDERAFQQCRIEGYAVALNNFYALAVFDEPKKEVEATFEPQEID